MWAAHESILHHANSCDFGMKRDSFFNWLCSGDPDASHLSIEERRLIKRRISNRESAQRVRQRKQDDNEEKLGEVRANLVNCIDHTSS